MQAMDCGMEKTRSLRGVGATSDMGADGIHAARGWGSKRMGAVPGRVHSLNEMGCAEHRGGFAVHSWAVVDESLGG